MVGLQGPEADVASDPVLGPPCPAHPKDAWVCRAPPCCAFIQRDAFEEVYGHRVLIHMNYTERGAWWATVHGVAKSRTRLTLSLHQFSVYHVQKALTTFPFSLE